MSLTSTISVVSITRTTSGGENLCMPVELSRVRFNRKGAPGQRLAHVRGLGTGSVGAESNIILAVAIY